MARMNLKSTKIDGSLEVVGDIVGEKITNSTVRQKQYDTLSDRFEETEAEIYNIQDLAGEIIDEASELKKDFEDTKNNINNSIKVANEAIDAVYSEVINVENRVEVLEGHNHDKIYSKLNHKHSVLDLTDLDLTHSHDDRYSKIGHGHTIGDLPHNHDDDYAKKNHEHLDLAKKSHKHSIQDLTDLDLKHSHDDRYSRVDHNHDDDYSRKTHGHTELEERIVELENNTTPPEHTHDEYVSREEIDEFIQSVEVEPEIYIGDEPVRKEGILWVSGTGGVIAPPNNVIAKEVITPKEYPLLTKPVYALEYKNDFSTMPTIINKTIYSNGESPNVIVENNELIYSNNKITNHVSFINKAINLDKCKIECKFRYFDNNSSEYPNHAGFAITNVNSSSNFTGVRFVRSLKGMNINNYNNASQVNSISANVELEYSDINTFILEKDGDTFKFSVNGVESKEFTYSIGEFYFGIYVNQVKFAISDLNIYKVENSEYVLIEGETTEEISKRLDKLEQGGVGGTVPGENLSELLTENKTSLVGAINEVFQGVVDGKRLIATAINDLTGSKLSGDETFEEIADILNQYEDGLIYWLDGSQGSGSTWNDKSLYKNNVAIKGSTPTWGKNCLILDGKTNYVALPLTKGDSNYFTFGIVFSILSHTVGDNVGTIICNFDQGGKGIEIPLGGTGQFYFQTHTGTYQKVAYTNYNLKQKYCAIMRYDGTKTQCYLDGVLVAEINGSITESGQPLVIGANPDGANAFSNFGNIEVYDFKYYDKCLSDDELDKLKKKHFLVKYNAEIENNKALNLKFDYAKLNNKDIFIPKDGEEYSFGVYVEPNWSNIPNGKVAYIVASGAESGSSANYRGICLLVKSDGTMYAGVKTGRVGAVTGYFGNFKNCTSMDIYVTWNNKTLNVYVNGELVKEIVASNYTYFESDKCYSTIGAPSFANENYFNGVIRELKIFSKCLTTEEVKEYSNKALSLSTEGLKHYWKMSEGEGNLLVDCIQVEKAVIQGSNYEWIDADILNE